jgi:hypothetical protein
MSLPIPRVSSLFCLFAVTSLLLGIAEADPSADLAAFSAFKKVDASKLAGGKPLSESASGFKFSRGAALQACYVIKQPMKKVLALQQSWNPAKRPGSKVFLHGDLSAEPVLADFSSLTTAPDNVAVRSLVRATESLDPANPALQMSAKEAAHFKGLTGGGSSGAIPEGIAKAWENLLFQRASAFAAGGVAAQPEYFSQKEPLRASAEAARLLQEQPKIQAQFQALLSSSGLEGAPKEPATLYYELFDVEGSGALSLGAYFQKGRGTAGRLRKCSITPPQVTMFC